MNGANVAGKERYNAGFVRVISSRITDNSFQKHLMKKARRVGLASVYMIGAG